ncbi:hypothetical protein RND71_028365 [Anisodus tanguticus]|uniref:Uncharacterized protein n=1 Tax=Anisodus tanguticus TaxID=243964 RepID=A0AAE1RLC6_9SOLA|nr:hypothetical protein RND71_028365 [Anisodus tanguticus]
MLWQTHQVFLTLPSLLVSFQGKLWVSTSKIITKAVKMQVRKSHQRDKFKDAENVLNLTKFVITQLHQSISTYKLANERQARFMTNQTYGQYKYGPYKFLRSSSTPSLYGPYKYTHQGQPLMTRGHVHLAYDKGP